MNNGFTKITKTHNAQARNAASITPDDDDVIEETIGLWIGTAGDVAVRFAGGTSITFTVPNDGTILPFAVDKVLATGTDAGSIVALYS